MSKFNKSSKEEVENVDQVSISALKAQGSLPYLSKFVELSWNDGYYKINLMYTSCNFGGSRVWLVCPICDERRGVIYKINNALGCRKCFDLTYHSRNFSKKLRDDGVFIGCNNLVKAQDLLDQVKRVTYGGSLTKKQQKIEFLFFKYFQSVYNC